MNFSGDFKAKANAAVQAAVDAAIGSGNEFGLQVAAYHEGELVVEVWDGLADETTGRKVDGDTQFNLYSVTKAVAAIAIHILLDRGHQDYDALAIHYWPEYGTHGKEKTTVRHVLIHRGCIPQMPEGVTAAKMCDWDWMSSAIADLMPLAEPGGKKLYLFMTFADSVDQLAVAICHNKMFNASRSACDGVPSPNCGNLLGAATRTRQADVSREEDVKVYVQAIIAKCGRIDVFFKNPSIEGKSGALFDQKIEDFDKVISVIVRGVFIGVKYVLNVMLKNGSGSIIYMSSVAGLVGSPKLSPYVTSQHAVVGMTKAASIEVAQKSIRINSVHPSPVNTRMMRSLEAGLTPRAAEKVKASNEHNIPMGRYGEVRDVSNVVLLLASDESGFVTGAQYRIDGGMAAL